MSALIKKSTSLVAAVTMDSSKKSTTVSSSNTETLIVCLDCSGSMRDNIEGQKTKMRVAIEAAIGLIQSCSFLSHVGAVAFHDTPAEVLQPSTGRGTLVEAINGFNKHEGGTQFTPALRSALSAVASHKWGSIKRIIFMSDGEDLGSPFELDGVVEQCASSKVIIDTVMFGHSPIGEETLKKMSSKTGGVFCLAKDAASLRKTFLSLEAGARGLLGKGKS